MTRRRAQSDLDGFGAGPSHVKLVVIKVDPEVAVADVLLANPSPLTVTFAVSEVPLL